MIAASNALAASSALVEALSVLDAARWSAPEDEKPAYERMTVEQAVYTICNVLEKIKLDIRGMTWTSGRRKAAVGGQAFQDVEGTASQAWSSANLTQLIRKFRRLKSDNVGRIKEETLGQLRELCDDLRQIGENPELF